MNLIIFILVSILFSAFFSGMEIAFVSSNKLRIEIDRKQKKTFAGIVSFFTKHPSRFIATMLVGNNIALVIYGITFAMLLEKPLRNILGNNAEAALLLVQTLISTLLILLTAEFLPKTLFRINPNNSLRLMSLPIALFYAILYPITLLTIGISNFTMKYLLRVKPDTVAAEPVFGKVDLDHFLTDIKPEQTTNGEETEDLKIFRNALEFSGLKVRECMIPRTEVIALELDSPLDDLAERFIETGLSRILIYSDTIDNVIGYVNSKGLFKKPEKIKSHLIPIQIVPETLPVNKLLTGFIKEGKSIALVVDEFGGTSGLITTEDIIEEIFGEIEDEHDTSDLVERILEKNHFLLSGRHEIDYLNEKYFLDIPVSEEYDTLAGYIIYHYESIPEKNTSVELDNFLITITDVSSNRIEEAELKVIRS
ncbi:MAG: hemolysin [Bacteroidetes bacterium]|nr:MAG: hemolysin [Bacteroidota bacterium]RLD94010.1 MAG: hemolysin [Bacteroidota bacterium]RLD94991.1 MAG: hemolysin [Bacteroidota bacterium]